LMFISCINLRWTSFSNTSSSMLESYDVKKKIVASS
jgi:hypothetical protein